MFGKYIHAARRILHHSTVLSFQAELKLPRNRLAVNVTLKITGNHIKGNQINHIVTASKRGCGKVMFSQASVVEQVAR